MRDIKDRSSSRLPVYSQPKSPRPSLSSRDDGDRAGGAHHEHRPTFRSNEELPRLVDTPAAARILGRSTSTLKRWRYEGIGLDYIEIEGRVRHDVPVLLEFLRQHTRAPSLRAQMEDSRETL